MWTVIEVTNLHCQEFRIHRVFNVMERKMNGEERTRRLAIEGSDVYNWPEFKAFAERLGIDWALPTTKLTITLGVGELVLVAQDYHGSERHLPNPLEEIPQGGSPYCSKSEVSGG